MVHPPRPRKADAHQKSGDDVPELHTDYCFMGKVDAKAQPILIVKEWDTRIMCNMLMRERGRR